MKGVLIAVDGVDGSGKSTFSRIIAQDLMLKYGGDAVLEVQQPGATKFGAELRRIVKSKEYPISPITERLIFAADAAEFYVQARRDMFEGKIIVSDRFTAVTDLVYGSASGTPLHLIYDLHDWIDPVLADLLIVFHCSWEVAKTRKVKPLVPLALGHVKESCRIEAKGDEYLNKVANVYKTISETLSKSEFESMDLTINQIAHHRAKRIRIVDSEQSWDDVRARVRHIIEELILEEAM
jgi:dTMP kinase